MIPILDTLLCIAGAALLLPAAVLCVEVLLGVSSARSARSPRREARSIERPGVAVLVPAHNEARTIGVTLPSIALQLLPGDRLVVIADNCTDATAAIAAAAGAEVLVRTDPGHRGKGYALDFAVRHLAAAPPDVVVVVDADCHVEAGAIDALARCCARTARPAQASYLMLAPQGADWRLHVAQFAWLLRNRIRPLGLQRLGLPCHLMGSGMAFPWAAIHAAQLASGDIVEDLKLGIGLARSGTPALLCAAARVTSRFPTTPEAIRSQRTRWEHGSLATLLRETPTLLALAVARRSVSLLALALDLAVPPLALLSLLIVALWAASLGWQQLVGPWLPLALSTGAAGLLMIAVLSAWCTCGRDVLRPRALASAGLYALGKLPLYGEFLRARQREWIRTKRDGDGP